MKNPIQNLILKFISENPRTQISDLVKALPDIDRSSVSSALTRLTSQGKLRRRQNHYGRFEYRTPKGTCIPDAPDEVPTPAAVSKQQKTVSPGEWQRRFSEAEALLNRGLARRANHAFLELLDVTTAAGLREKVIRGRNRCGSKPSGDSSSLAGCYVGDRK